MAALPPGTMPCPHDTVLDLQGAQLAHRAGDRRSQRPGFQPAVGWHSLSDRAVEPRPEPAQRFFRLLRLVFPSFGHAHWFGTLPANRAEDRLWQRRRDRRRDPILA